MSNKWIHAFLCLFLSLFCATHAEGGKILNPISDVCWTCLFPMHLGGVNVTPGHKDFVSYKPSLCACAGTPPKVGIPLAFWEPVALVEVTHEPYKCHILGGISLAKADVKNRGSVSTVGESGRHSFYNVHYYKFPLLSWLSVLPDFSCVQQEGNLDVTLSELDVLWSDDSWSMVLNPEASLFANPPAQAACIADCSATSLDKPQDELFWCAGCLGSLYPYTGHVSHHVGATQASYLLVNRYLAKMHAKGEGFGVDEHDFCEKKRQLRMKKTQYKTQLVFPVSNTKGPCQPLGKSDLIWGSGKSFPYKGEAFVYLIWQKNHCCLDAIKKAASGVAP